MRELRNKILNWLFDELQHRDAKLLPLRLFIGLGWIRAGVEKLVDPHWYSGDTLIEYLQTNALHGEAAFPIYRALMMGLFTEQASFFSNLVTAGELYAGLAIFFGFLTRPALLAGLFMNLNFVLAGTVNPSAFYIIIQLALLTSTVGRVVGLDGLLSSMRSQQLQSREEQIAAARFKIKLFFSGNVLSLLLMLITAPYIQTMDPAKSIDDPAMLLLILLGLQNLLCLTLGLQAVARQRQLAAIDPTPSPVNDPSFSPLVNEPNPSAGLSANPTLPEKSMPTVQSTDEYVYPDGVNLLYQ